MERKHQIIESLLAKPARKPDFSAFKGSDILKRAQEFMPKFIQTTDRLLSDPELLKHNQMDIKVVDKDMQQEEEDKQQLETGHISMDIGVGVFDIQNEHFDEKGFQPSSSEPIVRVQGMPQEMADSDSESSDDSNLYYEFGSDDDQGDTSSFTTKSTSQATSTKTRAPLIVDITEQCEQNKQKQAKKRLKKRLRKQQ